MAIKIFNYKDLSLLSIVSAFCFETAGFFPWDYVLNNNKGIVEYNKKSFNQAETLFNLALQDKKDDIEIKYNLANNYYKQKKYIESQTLYLDILNNQNTSGELKEKIHYNLGNVLYRLGEQSNPELFWSNSLKEYQRAMNIVSEDKQAKENYDFVFDKLKKLNPPPPQSGKDKKQSNEGQNNQPQAYSNNLKNSQLSNSNSSVTQAEAENILKELKNQEENMQSYVNKRQASFEDKLNNQASNNLKKDW